MASPRPEERGSNIEYVSDDCSLDNLSFTEIDKNSKKEERKKRKLIEIIANILLASYLNKEEADKDFLGITFVVVNISLLF